MIRIRKAMNRQDAKVAKGPKAGRSIGVLSAAPLLGVLGALGGSKKLRLRLRADAPAQPA
jgi:hypothetical protein